MPNSVDNKIVEMQFDNANFEKNVKQSIKTLEALNKALELEDAAKGFEQMEKAVDSIDLSKLTRAADMIEKRFSAAGIAGAALINRGVNGAINAVKKLGSTVIGLAKTGGINRALNLEHANFMLEGILKDSKKVAAIMNGPVNDAVTGTAYGLDSAAKAAGQFVASGITDLERLRVALTGISGVAAMSGSSYDEIARIFNKVAARGKVMGDTIQELSTRGIAAQEELAKHLKVTVAEVQELQKKGEISFEAFSDAMYNAFAEQAKKANKTFTGALSNVKAALSRIGAKIATPALENLRMVFVSLIRVINKVNEILSSSLIKNVRGLISKLGTLAVGLLNSKKFMELLEKTINNIGAGFEMILSIIRPIKEAFRAIFPRASVENLIVFNEKLAELIERLTVSGEKAGWLHLTFKGLFAAIDIGLTLVKQLLSIFLPSFSGLYETTDNLETKLLKITGTIGYLVSKFDEWLKKNNIFKIGLDKLNQALGLTGERTLKLSTIINTVVKAVGTVLLGIIGVFYLIGSAVANFISVLYNLPAVQMIIEDLRGAIERLGTLALPIIEKLAGGFVVLLDSVMAFGEGGYITAGLEKLNDALNSGYWGIKNAIGVIGTFFGLFKKSEPAIEKMETVVVAAERYEAAAESMGVTSGVVVRTTNEVREAGDTVVKTMDNVASTATGTMMTLEKAGKIFAIGFGASVISAGVNVGRAFRDIGKAVKNIGGVGKSIKLFFEQLNLSIRIKTLLAVAGTIVVFAGALAMLTMLDPGRLILAAVIVGALTAALVYMSKVLASSKDLFGIAKFQTMAYGILQLSTSIFILAAAAKILMSFGGDWSSLWTALVGLFAATTFMVMSIIAIGRFQRKAIQGTLSMVAFSGAVYIMVGALQKLANADLDNIERAIPSLLRIIAGMTAISVAVSLVISPFGGLAFIGVVAGIILFIEALTALGSVDYKVLMQVEQLIDYVVTAATALLSIIALMKLFETVGSIVNLITIKIKGITGGIKDWFSILKKGLEYIGIGLMILSIAEAIKTTADAIIALSAIPINDLIKGGVAVVAIGAVITILTTAIIKIATYILVAEASAMQLAAGFAGIGFAILSVAASVKILAGMESAFVDGLEKVGIICVGILGFLWLLGQLAKINDKTITIGIKTFAGIAILLGILVASIAIIALIPWEAYIPAMASIVAVMATLGLVLLAVASMSSMATPATFAIYGLIGIVVAMGTMALLLKDIPIGNILVHLGEIELALLGMTAILWLLGSISSVATLGLIALGVITGILVILTGVATMITLIDPDMFAKNMETLYGALLIFSVAIFVLGSVGPVAEIGVTILGMLAVAMLAFATAAKNFAIAAYTAGEGLTMIASSVTELNGIDLGLVAEGLLKLKDALSELGKMTDIMHNTADGMRDLVPTMGGFSDAIAKLSISLASLNGTSIDNIMALFIRLGEAIDFVNDRALEFGGFSIIAMAVGGSCMVLGAGLMTATGGLISFGAAVDMVCLGISILVAAFRSLGEIVLKIVDSMTNMVNSIKSMGAETVSAIYDALITYASTQLFEAGQSMVHYIQEGFEEASGTFASEVVQGLVDGLATQVAMRETEIYQAGWKLADIMGHGIFEGLEINSPSRLSMRAVDYVVDGFDEETSAQQSFMESIGSFLGEYYGNGMVESAKKAGKDLPLDTANTIAEYSKKNAQAVYDAGEILGTAYDEGVRDPTGSYCINEHKDLPADTDASIAEGVNEVKGNVYNSGEVLGNAYSGGVWDSLKTNLNKIKAKVNEWWKNISNGNFLLGGDVIANTQAQISETMEKAQREAGLFGKATGPYYRLNNANTITHKQLNDARDEGRKKLREYMEASKDAEEASKDETSALDENTKGTKSSSKAKKENKKANDKKTKAINEETEALDEETESVEDNEQAIRDQAEQIEIVTEKFKDYLNAYKFADPMRNALRLNKAFSRLWSSNDKSLKDVNASYKKASEALSKSMKTVNKQVLSFNDSGKYVGKFSKSLYKNVEKIEKKVSKTGKTLMKVIGPTTKVFYKVGNSVETMTITTTKNLRKLGKHFEQAKNFLSSFNAEIEHQESSEEFILNLRNIERFFGATKFGKMATKAQDYIRGIVNEFEEVGNSMNILAKNIDGIGNVLSKKSKASAYVADSFLALAASMYDGSDAANEYATEHAKLLFLMENGLATQEEVDEHFQSYISRLKQTIVDYRNTIYENLSGSMDIFSKFNQNLLEEGTDLITNIESQIAGYYNWGNMLMELSKRGFDSGIIKILTDEGVSSFGKAKALMEMTGNELALFTIRYQQSQAVIEQATDTALAAVANAQTRASLRAAAAQGDKTAQQQLKQSKKNKKALLDDARAVAEFQAKYRKLSANEEKKYLKSLSKEERKAYKSQLKAAKKQQKDLEKAAKAEESKRAEESRIATIRESIKTFNDYIHAINKYNNDSAVMKDITESITKSFEPLNGALAEFTDVTRDEAINSLLYFAETLEATGNEGNDYFTEMTQRLQNYVATLKDAIKSQLTFTDAIKITQNGYSPDKFVGNMTGNLAKAVDVQTLTQQLIDKYGTANVNNIVTDIAKRLKDNGSIGEVLEILKTYIGMTKEEIMAMNSALFDADKVSEKLANQMLTNVSKVTMDSKAEERFNKAKEDVNKFTDAVKNDTMRLENATSEYEYAYNKLKENEEKIASTSVAILKLEKKKKDTGLTKKEKEQLSAYKMNLKSYQDANKSYQKEVDERKAIMDSAQEAYNSSTRDLAAAQNELTEATKAYERALREFNDAKANEANIRARQEAEQKLEAEAYAILNLITTYESLISIEKKYSKESRIMTKITSGMKVVIKSVSGAIDEYGRRWKSVTNLSKKVNSDVDIITRAFLRMSDTLTSSGELTGTYFENAAQKLSEYRDTLYDTIKGQVSLFDTFNKSSGDKMTSASTYLDNMQSQLTGLEEWLTGLETLAKRGINGDILQVFAAEGQGSYEKVMAFVNATDEQLGELMAKYNEYNALTAAAADRAMAAIGSTYTDAAMKASKDLIDLFHKTGATRLQEEAYNAGLMIITGVKNGLGNSMPEIISVTSDTADAVSTTLSNTIGQSIGKAINTGVIQAVGNSVEATVNAAIEKFKMAVDTVNSYVQETLNDEWSITVHVNTSEIDAAVARMNSAIYGINAQATTTQDAYISSRQSAMPTVDIEPVQTAPTQDVVLNYTQNNYSPSALSRAEIYRQTRNQLSTIEGVVSAATGG